MADKYAWIIFKNKSIGNDALEKCNSFIQFKSKIIGNKLQDEEFYEKFMYFSAKVLANAFDKSDIPKLEDELSRLFRTNAFNIA